MAAALSPLQPLGMGQLIDRAFRLYRQNFLSFLGIIALSQIPFAILSIGLTSTLTLEPTFLAEAIEQGSFAESSNFLIGAGLVSLVLFVVGIVLSQFAAAAVTIAIAKQYLGQEIGIIDAYREIKSSWKPMLWAVVLGFLLLFGIFIWTIVPCIGWFTGFGMLIVAGLAITPFVVPIIVLERRSAVDAFYRAWGLVRRRFWWVFGFMLLLTLLVTLVVVGPTSLFNFLLLPTIGSGLSVTMTTVIQQTIQFLFRIVLTPIQFICIVLLYFDMRVRTEAFDLALLANPAASEGDLAVFKAETVVAKDGSLITGTELGYFAMITLGFVALYVLLIIVAVLISFAFVGAAGF